MIWSGLSQFLHFFRGVWSLPGWSERRKCLEDTGWSKRRSVANYDILWTSYFLSWIAPKIFTKDFTSYADRVLAIKDKTWSFCPHGPREMKTRLMKCMRWCTFILVNTLLLLNLRHFKFWLCYFLVWPWSSCLALLCLRLLTDQWGIIVANRRVTVRINVRYPI